MPETTWHRIALPPSPGKLDQLEAGIDWEPLHFGIRGASVTRLGRKTGDIGSITILRGNEYEIRGVIETSIDIATVESLGESIVGRLIPEFNLEAVASHAIAVRSSNCAIRRFVSETTVGSPAQTFVELLIPTMTLQFGKQSAESQTTTTEWFLSGPEQIHFPRRTVRETHRRFIRRRMASPHQEEVPAFVRPPADRRYEEHSTFDHLLLQLGTVKALVAEVPQKFHPPWSSAISIEYHHEKGQTPPDSMRDLVADAVGFLFGRQLLCVGRTGYDAAGYPIEQYACNPWGYGVRRTCATPDLPPVRIQHHDLESSFNRIVATFLEKGLDLGLRDALWMVWMALCMPVGFDLPLYAAALERVMTAWFKSTRSRTKGLYMPKSEYDALLQIDFASIDTKLDGKQYSDRISRRLRSAFQMGVNERFEIFFAELGLPIGKFETEAIRTRNDFAHPGGKQINDDQKQVKLGRAYMTLLYRVILKVLGHQGTYTDYSADHHPEKGIDEPIGPL